MPPKKPKLSSRKKQRDAYDRQRAARRQELASQMPGPSNEGSEDVGGDQQVLISSDAECQTSKIMGVDEEVHKATQVSQDLATVETQTLKVMGMHPEVDQACQNSPIVKSKASQAKVRVHYRSVMTQMPPSTNDTENTLAGFAEIGDKGNSSKCQEDIVIETEFNLESLSKSLQESLSEKWTISSKEGALHIVQLENLACPVISKAVLLHGKDIGIFIHGHPLKNSHELWDDTVEFSVGDGSNASNIIKTLIGKIETLNVCKGVKKCDEVWNEGIFAQRGFTETMYQISPVYRSSSCALLINQEMCSACKTEQTNMIRQVNRRARRATEIRDVSRVNLKYLPRHSLEAALKESREKNTKYKRQIKFMRKRIDNLIEKQGEVLNKQWSKEFVNINKKNFDKMTDIQKLFWDQQMKRASLRNKASMKWHPMMIKMALNFQMVSNSAYENSQNAGFISLPSKRTLYDYSHCISAKTGIQKEVLEDIKEELDKKCHAEDEKFMNLMFDGMHIRANLVYQKSSGELVGYANLTELEQEFEELKAEWTGTKSTPPLAKEVLVFLVKNITVNDRERIIKSVVAVYSIPPNMPAAGLYTRLWEVIYSLESCGIPVISVTCDGASINRSCINLHTKYIHSENDEWYDYSPLEDEPVNVTLNIASPDLRPLFFFIDPPHIIKTLRNAFANSYYHRKSRKLWNLEDISWGLVVREYEDHKFDKFRKSMISASHVYLTAFSCMSVSLASQVLSKTLAEAIKKSANEAAEKGKSYPPHEAATVFMSKSNDFFDRLNGAYTTSHIRFRNKNLAPYCLSDDERFDELKDFLHFLDTWKERVLNREGSFSKKAKKAMLLPEQTTSAIHTTVRSFIRCVRYLLKVGAKSICARRFCQDPLEQTFSTYRRKGGSSNNPDLANVLQTRVTTHAQGQLAIPSSKGNTTFEKEEIVIDPTPLPKRKRRADDD